MKDVDLDQHLRDWARDRQPNEFTEYSLRARVLAAASVDGSAVRETENLPRRFGSRRRMIALGSLAALILLSLTPLFLLNKSNPAHPQSSQTRKDHADTQTEDPPPPILEPTPSPPSVVPFRTVAPERPEASPGQTVVVGESPAEPLTPPDLTPPLPHLVPTPLPQKQLVQEVPGPERQPVPIPIHTRTPATTAVLTFLEEGRGVRGKGERVAQLLSTELSARYHPAKNPQNLTILPSEVRGHLLNTVGDLVDTRILVSGSISVSRNTIYLRVRVTDRDTDEEQGYSVSGPRDKALAPLVTALATQVKTSLPAPAPHLVAKPTTEERLASLRELLRNPEDSAQILAAGMAFRSRYYESIDQELTGLLNDSGFFRPADQIQTVQPAPRATLREFARFRWELARIRSELHKQPDRKASETIEQNLQTSLSAFLRDEIDNEKALQTTAQELAKRLLPKLAK